MRLTHYEQQEALFAKAHSAIPKRDFHFILENPVGVLYIKNQPGDCIVEL
jgi:hypothetical protein